MTFKFLFELLYFVVDIAYAIFRVQFLVTYIVHAHTVHSEYCHLPNNYVSMSSQQNKLSTTLGEYDTRRGHTYKQSKKIIWKAIINSSHLLGLCVCRHQTSGSILNIHFLKFSFSPFSLQFTLFTFRLLHYQKQ